MARNYGSAALHIPGVVYDLIRKVSSNFISRDAPTAGQVPMLSRGMPEDTVLPRFIGFNRIPSCVRVPVRSTGISLD